MANRIYFHKLIDLKALQADIKKLERDRKGKTDAELDQLIKDMMARNFKPAARG